MSRWEYKIVNPKKVDINILGSDGWFAFAITFDTHTGIHWAFLRRRLEAA